MSFYKFADGTFVSETEIKRSKFIATLKGEIYGEQAENFVAEIRKKYSDATHNCYAYTGDLLGNFSKFSDDGEPSGTAGQPMLEVIKKQDLYGTAVVVTRYFGGIKLGTGGLARAYTDAVCDVIKKAQISQKVLCCEVKVIADYATFALLQNYCIRQGVVLKNVVYENEVSALLYVDAENCDKLLQEISALTCGNIRYNILGTKYKQINLAEFIDKKEKK